jgi:HlyD family secretion protein
MIKNRRWRFGLGCIALGAMAALSACAPKAEHPGAFQGVVEFEERVLGFEVGGRVASVEVERGAVVRAGQSLAALDATLERAAHESREAEAKAAEAQASLVRAGTRPEDVRAMEAQLRAAVAGEALLRKNLAREQELLATGAVAQVSVDALASRLDVAVAERQAIEQRLRGLKSGARRQEVDSVEARAASAVTAARLGAERVRRYELSAAQAGTVLEVHVDPGEVVAAGSPVLTLADTTHPYAEVFVPEAELGGVHVGATASLRVDATREAFQGRVEHVGRRAEFTPRYLFSERERPSLVMRVRVRIDDPEQRLHAGVPAFVTIERGAGAPVSPSEAPGSIAKGGDAGL